MPIITVYLLLPYFRSSLDFGRLVGSTPDDFTLRVGRIGRDAAHSSISALEALGGVKVKDNGGT